MTAIANHMSAWSGKALPYLRRVAYLESHGTEWIDTGVRLRSLTDSLYVKYIANVVRHVSAIAGSASFYEYEYSRTYGLWNDYKCADLGNNRNEILENRAYVKDATTGVVSEGFISANIRYVGKSGLIENQNTKRYEADWLTDSIYLFWANGIGTRQDKSKIKMIEAVMMRGDSELFHAVPVIDLSGRPAMYDEVSGQFFYNQGTGEFTWGELD